MIKKMINNIKKHPINGAVGHFLEGMGVGIVIARPIIGIHPVRFGLGLFLLGAAIELYPMLKKG